MGSNEDIFEYLRDSDYSLSSAIVRSFQTGNWTEQQKKDYVYLKNKFEEVYWAGFHFGRCIHARSYPLHPLIPCKIVINLCMVFPQDNWQQTLEGNRIKDPSKIYSPEEEKILRQAHQEKQYYLWCNQGFNRIKLIWE
jgi:hypothetical protein